MLALSLALVSTFPRKYEYQYSAMLYQWCGIPLKESNKGKGPMKAISIHEAYMAVGKTEAGQPKIMLTVFYWSHHR